jgi:hypothetical protein
MKETALWSKLRISLNRRGKFQKVSDRFTPGVPDVLGVYNGRPWAIELKEFSGKNTVHVTFRPGQLDWLRDWHQAGGISLVMVSHGLMVYIFRWEHGVIIEEPIPLSTMMGTADLVKRKTEEYKHFCQRFLEHYNDHY